MDLTREILKFEISALALNLGNTVYVNVAHCIVALFVAWYSRSRAFTGEEMIFKVIIHFYQKIETIDRKNHR